ncbi:hypothetical protein N9I21_04100 [Crocinitomicaceae bacterium]|nr:hypothetical protein [Crocinitomicaceae bacterium]
MNKSVSNYYLKTKYVLFIFFCSTLIIGCGTDNSTNSDRDRELDLKAKELELKEKELKLKEKDSVMLNSEVLNHEKNSESHGASDHNVRKELSQEHEYDHHEELEAGIEDMMRGHQNDVAFAKKQELNNPGSFMSVSGSWKVSLLGNTIINGTIYSYASHTEYKNPIVRITYYTPSDREIGHHDFYVDGWIGPEGSLSFNKKIKEWYDADKASMEVISSDGESVTDENGEFFAACFTGEGLVTLADNSRIRIDQLKVGDEILAYNTKDGACSEATVQEMFEVNHSNLVRIELQGNSITSTDDHPYWVKEKGWCSLDPESTKKRYDNYSNVSLLKSGDVIIAQDQTEQEVTSISYLNESEKTYTITKLSNGDSFFLNGLIVGVEEFAPIFEL